MHPMNRPRIRPPRRHGAAGRGSAPVARVCATLALLGALGAAAPIALAAPSAPATITLAVAPPSDLRDVGAWVSYRTQRHLGALPLEARLFYRRGLMAHLAGQDQQAFANVRGAADLDPGFIEPQLTLASWLLTREPSQALLHYASALDLLRRNFDLQLDLAANALILGLEGLFAGMLGAALLVVWLRRYELVHAWREHLARFASAGTARWWARALLVLPFLTGFGVTLPTLGLFGYLWPSLRARERVLFVALVAFVVAIPVGLRTLDRLALALRADAAPFYDVLALENVPWSPALQAHYTQVAARAPGNPFVQFGLGWLARRGGDLDTAERAYRAALAGLPDQNAVLTDLGNVLAVKGRVDDALACYQRAERANPLDAAAHFNASQLYTQRFDYQAATDELGRATAANFELVRTYQGQAGSDGLLPLVDEWPQPLAFWNALRAAPAASAPAVLPLSLRAHAETSGWAFSAVALAFALLGLAGGLWQHRSLPLRVCSNCGTVICRRCAQRRREHALCPACAEMEARAETPEFSRVLLLQLRSRRQRGERLVRTAFAALVPGYGLLAHRHVFTAVALLSTAWTTARLWLAWTPPFASEPHLVMPGEEVPVVALAVTLVVVYAVSLLGYFRLGELERRREAALAAAQRGRITQSSRRVSSVAA